MKGIRETSTFTTIWGELIGDVYCRQQRKLTKNKVTISMMNMDIISLKEFLIEKSKTMAALNTQ